MKLIPLTRGQFAQVDDDDFENLNQFKWCALKSGENFYAQRTPMVNRKKCKAVLMHRVIMDAKTGTIIDHKNHNGLDNRKENLRFCTASQNHTNVIKVRGKSIFKGVVMRRNGFCVQIRVNNKRKYVGYFKNEEDAARAYNEAAIKYHGEFAGLNLIYNL